MKSWPRQQLPQNFNFLPEQKWTMKPLPRDTGRIPRDFVLTVVYKAQPVNVAELWGLCTCESGCVLDSKRHLRDVLKQAREEGFLVFERDEATDAWSCSLTRERFEEVRSMVTEDAATQTAAHAGLRGKSADKTTELAAAFQHMDRSEKLDHVDKLREALRDSNAQVEQFQRTEAEYLPYTTLNGKVDFMWWYESRDVSASAAGGGPDGDVQALPSGTGAAPQLPSA